MGCMCLSKQKLSGKRSGKEISLFWQLVSGEKSKGGLFCQHIGRVVSRVVESVMFKQLLDETRGTCLTVLSGHQVGAGSCVLVWE